MFEVQGTCSRERIVISGGLPLPGTQTIMPCEPAPDGAFSLPKGGMTAVAGGSGGPQPSPFATARRVLAPNRGSSSDCPKARCAPKTCGPARQRYCIARTTSAYAVPSRIAGAR
jgi:hypothetical protein